MVVAVENLISRYKMSDKYITKKLKKYIKFIGVFNYYSAKSNPVTMQLMIHYERNSTDKWIENSFTDGH